MNKTTRKASASKPRIDHIGPVVLSHGNVNWGLAITITVVAIVGILCLYSVSVSLSESVMQKQVPLLAIGFAVMYIFSHIDTSFYQKRWVVNLLLFFGLGLMIYCLGKNFSQEIKRSVSFGFFSVEPSEILKFAAIIYIGYYAQRHKDDLKKQGLKPVEEAKNPISAIFLRMGHWLNSRKLFLICPNVTPDGDFFFDDSFWYHIVLAFWVALPLGLIIYSSHLSATIIYCIVALYLLFYSGAKPKYLKTGLFVALLLVAAYFMFFISDYQMERLEDWDLLPEDKSQSRNALYAICSGGLTGKGYLNSTEKFGYVAESKNDFIFSIFCEEFGLFGAISLILGFSLLVILIYKTGRKSQDTFDRRTVKGIAVMIATQVMLHIAVNTSLLPNTGITLPFFSSGGSALLINFAEMGYVLSVSRKKGKTKSR